MMAHNLAYTTKRQLLAFCMNEAESDDDKHENRVFPRLTAECAVLYAIGTSEDWKVGIMSNMSATGLSMKCPEQLLKNINISIIIKPGDNKTIPQIEAAGKVTRCTQIDEHEYEVSCKLIKIKNKSP